MSLLDDADFQGGIAQSGYSTAAGISTRRGIANRFAKLENLQNAAGIVGELGVGVLVGNALKPSAKTPPAWTPGSGGAGADYLANPSTGSLSGGSQSYDPTSINPNAQATPGPISSVDHNTAPVVGAFINGQYQGVR